MTINLKGLGAALLTTGPLLVQFGGAQLVWYLGVTFTAIGPILIAITPAPPKSKPKRRRRKKRKP